MRHGTHSGVSRCRCRVIQYRSVGCDPVEDPRPIRCWTRSIPPDYSVPYLQTGSPSPALVTSGFVVFTPIPQEKLVSWLCVFVASHEPA